MHKVLCFHVFIGRTILKACALFGSARDDHGKRERGCRLIPQVRDLFHKTFLMTIQSWSKQTDSRTQKGNYSKSSSTLAQLCASCMELLTFFNKQSTQDFFLQNSVRVITNKTAKQLSKLELRNSESFTKTDYA